MPRKFRPNPGSRPVLTYSKQNMIDAVTAVKEGKMGLKLACKKFGVKRTALQKRVQGKVSLDARGSGRPTMLHMAVEDEIALYYNVLISWGLEVTDEHEQLQDLVAGYLKTMEIKNAFPRGRPGEDWLHQGFLKRHPELVVVRNPVMLPSGRAEASGGETVDRWFALLRGTMKKLELSDKPRRVYSVDATGLRPNSSKLKAIAEDGSEHVFRVIGVESKGNKTNQGWGPCSSSTSSESGQISVPVVGYSDKKIGEESATANGSYIEYSSDAGIECATFYDWFKNKFLAAILEARPVILLFQGLASHLTLPLVKIALDNQVTVLRVPSNIAEHVQPLDVGVYGPGEAVRRRILMCAEQHREGKLEEDESGGWIADVDLESTGSGLSGLCSDECDEPPDPSVIGLPDDEQSEGWILDSSG